MSLTIYGESDIGFTRRRNEDAIGWYQSATGNNVVAVLADGVGGHEGGDVASQKAVEVCLDLLAPVIEQQRLHESDVTGALNAAITEANGQIRELKASDNRLSGMGTTLSTVCVIDGQAFFANIGDSRCYRVNGQFAFQVTRDDTVAQAMVDDGSIAESEVSSVPFRNVLTKVLGGESEVVADIQRIAIETDDLLLLCSDGLTGAVSSERWPALIAPQKNIRQQVGCLIDESLNNRVNDNVSVILIRQQT